MSYLIEDGDTFQEVADKLNNILDILKMAETDEVITAGAVTSIPVATLGGNYAHSGDTVYMIDPETGEAYTLSLSANALSGDNALTVSSYTFAADVASGAKIYYPMTKLLAYVY